MIPIKSDQEIIIMREAAQITLAIRQELVKFLKVGISTWELDMIACDLIKNKGIISAFKGYKGYQGYTCISVNEVVVHGLPSKKCILKSGDIVTLDIGIYHKGYYSDSAWTYFLGDIPFRTKSLLENTQKALLEGIQQIKPNAHVSDISRAIAKVGKNWHYGIVEIFSGHGIGKKLHEEPYIFNFDFTFCDYLLKPGMVLCIEPMFTLGSKEVRIMSDGWTAITSDYSLSAHYEHMVLVTKQGYEILT